MDGNSIADVIRLVGDNLTSFGTGENNRTVPGRQHLDWEENFKALAGIAYKNSIVFKPSTMMGGKAGRDIHVFRHLLDNPPEGKIDFLLNFEKVMI